MNNRLSNIETLRIVAMFLIVLGHFIGFSTCSRFSCVTTENQDLISTILCRLISFHVPLFIIITGYFGISFKFKSFISLFVKCMIYSLLIVGVWFAIFQKTFDWHILTNSIRFFSLDNSWWFINYYLQLFLISPLLNMFIKTNTSKNFTKALLLLLFVNCIWGGMLRGTFNRTGFNLNEFILLYMIGRYIRLIFVETILYKNVTKRNLLIYFCFSELFLWLTWNLIVGYANPFAIASAICLFLIFSKISFQSKVVNWFASSALVVYLLTDQGVIIRPLVIKTLGQLHVLIPNYGQFLLFLIALTCVIFLIAVFIDKLLSFILINRIVNYIAHYDLFAMCNNWINIQLSKKSRNI